MDITVADEPTITTEDMRELQEAEVWHAVYMKHLDEYPLAGAENAKKHADESVRVLREHFAELDKPREVVIFDGSMGDA